MLWQIRFVAHEIKAKIKLKKILIGTSKLNKLNLNEERGKRHSKCLQKQKNIHTAKLYKRKKLTSREFQLCYSISFPLSFSLSSFLSRLLMRIT